jgi:hypothetical protein
VDPYIIEAIEKIPLPKDKNSLQSFFGKINFIRRFFLDFTKIVKHLNRLLKKDACFEWDDDGKKDFQHIKEEITITPVLISPDLSKYFIIFSFASRDTIVGVLLQKNDQEDEQLISFMRKSLRDLKINYTIVEK